MNPFAFNKDATYKAGAFYTPGAPSKLTIAGSLEIVVREPTESGKFTTRVPDIFSKYKLPPVSSNNLVDLWNSEPMQFWQNQLNFAVWCATTGCGVSAKDHLGQPAGLSRALYLFHAYYQVRRILKKLKVALPQDQSWSAFENSYDRSAYEEICSEFGVDPHTDWRRKGLPNYGLGKVYTNGHPIGDGWYYPNFIYGWRGSGTNWTHDVHAQGTIKESFTEGTGSSGRGFILHADHIAQDDPNAAIAWTMFILDESQGFTQPGEVRLNDSIRTYVWAVLGAQAQVRACILGTGTAFDAQKQFKKNLKDAISSPEDIPLGIKGYQDTLQKASSKLDYVFGIDLNLAPRDMRLNIGHIQGYNNQIVVATPGMTIGSNIHVNASPVPPPGLSDREPDMGYEPQPYVPVIPVAGLLHDSRSISAAYIAAANQHADEKTALVSAAVAIGLVFAVR